MSLFFLLTNPKKKIRSNLHVAIHQELVIRIAFCSVCYTSALRHGEPDLNYFRPTDRVNTCFQRRELTVTKY